jgi:DNA-binding MarR family transcriptional regulator
LRAAIARINRRLRSTPAATAAGLTATSSSILFTVVRRGSIRLSDLAADEGVNPTMLSRIAGKLVDAKLLERSSDPADGRAALVSATKQGRRLAERIRRERTDALNAALEPLAAGDQAALADALGALEALAEELRR